METLVRTTADNRALVTSSYRFLASSVDILGDQITGMAREHEAVHLTFAAGPRSTILLSSITWAFHSGD